MADARSAHSKAESEWQRALELERRLKATYRKRSFYDPEARTLRGQLRSAYESLLFLDAAFAAANDVELALWKGVFYRPIEEFRTRLKQADKAGDAGASAGPKVAAAFMRFLEEASLFYRRLVMQLQAAYGDVGVKLAVEAAGAAGGGVAAANGAAAMLCSSGSSAPRDVRPSIHRCLIYLGDLARYTAQAAPKAAPAAAAAAGAGPGQHPAAMPDWQRAGYYYRLAARVLPRSGNPHNQLAVMSVMVGEALRAVYHYARSLCVGIPFWTARENLLLLFEQNRARYGEFAAQRRQRPQQQQQQLGQLLSDVSICYGACGKPVRAANAAQAGAAAAAAAARGGSGSAGGDAACDGGALPEELELLGFEPLRSKHHWHVTDVGKAAVDEPATRACRMLAAARVVSASLAAEQQLGRHAAAAAAAGGPLQLGGLAGHDQGSGFGLAQGEGLAPDSPTSPEGDGLTLLEYLAKQQQQQQQQLAGALSGIDPAAAAGGTAGALAGALNPPPGYNGVGFGGGGMGLGAQQGLGLGLGSGAFGGAGAVSGAGLFAGGGPAVLLPPLDIVQSQNPFAS
ncbi:hypothetical protein OEZ85_000866 [Tetradesmus obliquus]|uniref:Telomerase activating protein Est1-like N-terminal domain-containing protein n=1 Tax=Tetradesmus obliquus TaxID=3088 RepID=A0ABY8UJI9_TETOB|nr:hypothetical protein OEZ85_000866 [Tetradesmus obliquus]